MQSNDDIKSFPGSNIGWQDRQLWLFLTESELENIKTWIKTVIVDCMSLHDGSKWEDGLFLPGYKMSKTLSNSVVTTVKYNSSYNFFEDVVWSFLFQTEPQWPCKGAKDLLRFQRSGVFWVWNNCVTLVAFIHIHSVYRGQMKDYS